MGRIVVVGSSNTDMVVQTPHLPAPGETVLGGTFFQAAGGKGANQAVAAARAGGTVSFIASVGLDDLGHRALAGFKAEGIDVSRILQIESISSGIALIVVDEAGENCIAVAPGANAQLLPAALSSASEAIDQSDVVLLQMEIPLETVIEGVRMASSKGKVVVLNPAPAQSLPETVWSNVSVLTPNRSEAELLSGVSVKQKSDARHACRALLNKGVGAVVLTFGDAGAFVATASIQTWVDGFSVRAIDTTGAGDVFNGALAVALADGASLVESTRFANAAAAVSVTRFGAQPSAPSKSEILECLRE